MIAADTSAFFAILEGEADAAALADRAARATRVLFSAASLVELQILVIRRRGRKGLAELAVLLADLAVTIVPFDAEQAAVALQAAERYGKGSGSPARLNLGDCFAYALARSRDLPLLFKGDDFVRTDIRPALAAP